MPVWVVIFEEKGKVIKVIPIDKHWQILKLMAAGF
jgi:hypothetical protein